MEKTKTGTIPNGTTVRTDGNSFILIEESTIIANGNSVEAIFIESDSLSIFNSHIESSAGSTIFVCCQEAGEQTDIYIFGSTVRQGTGSSAISGSGDQVSFTIENSTIDGNLSADLAKVVRSSTVLGTLSGAGPETCVAVATDTAFFAATCP